MTLKQALLRTGIATLILVLVLGYMMFLVPLDHVIDVRESAVSIGSIAVAFWLMLHSWVKYFANLLARILHDLSKKENQK